MDQIKELKAEKLKVKIYDSRLEMGAGAAYDVAQKVKQLLLKQKIVNMIFAAAPSQNEFLSSLCYETGIDWSRINAFHMDEYIGLENKAPQCFGQFLYKRIFGKVFFNKVYYINGCADDIGIECRRYAGLLKQFPADIVCMGIGENSHVAFNDPHVADFNDPLMVKEVTLDKTSRQQQVHDGCFAHIEEVPVSAITLTIPALFDTKNIYCVVPGSNKALAIYHTFYSEVKENYPSTILRKHNNAKLYLDKNSAAKL